MSDDAELLRELARVKALFQARTLAMVMGIEPERVTTEIRKLDPSVWGRCFEREENV